MSCCFSTASARLQVSPGPTVHTAKSRYTRSVHIVRITREMSSVLIQERRLSTNRFSFWKLFPKKSEERLFHHRNILAGRGSSQRHLNHVPTHPSRWPNESHQICGRSMRVCFSRHESSSTLTSRWPLLVITLGRACQKTGLKVTKGVSE